MNFDPPSQTTWQAGRLPLRLVAAASVIVAQTAMSVALMRRESADLVVIAGHNVVQLGIVLCGVIAVGLGTLVLSVTNQVAHSREQTASLGMFLIVFVVVSAWALLALALLFLSLLASGPHYTRLNTASGSSGLLVESSGWREMRFTLHSGHGIEYTNLHIAMPDPDGRFDPFSAGEYTLIDRGSEFELSFPLRPGGVNSIIEIPKPAGVT